MANKNLRGTFEAVPFQNKESLLLYLNTEYSDFDTHWHPAAEIIMPIENGYQATIGRQVFRLKERDILFIPPGVLHSLQAPPDGKRMIFLFNFTPISSLQDFSPLLSVLSQPMLISAAESEPLLSSSRFPATGKLFESFEPQQADIELHREAHRLMQQIIDTYPDRTEPLRVPMIYSYLIQFFVLIGRRHIRRDLLTQDSKSRKQSDCYERLNASLNFINANYMNDISVEDAARSAGFSKFHFSRLFKQFTDQTFCGYLNQRRINAAETLLLNPRLSVTDVALQSGFSSLSTFNRAFRMLKACTPSEFKAYHQRRGIRVRKRATADGPTSYSLSAASDKDDAGEAET
ncbi:MAG: helix-turn-helix transcriptional regulator [Lachnospiraceae bacterium]|nr:helix-turn-helix transcriptional regulator [Lachnospiraceae bacterium]